MIRRFLLVVVGGIALLNSVAVACYAAPAPLPADGASYSGMTLRLDRSLDAGSPRERLAAMAEALKSAEFARLPGGLASDAAHDRWWERVFFLPALGAGAAVYAPVFHGKAFLVPMDVVVNRTLKTGRAHSLRRRLEGYPFQEAAQLATAARFGTLRLHGAPHWTRGGTAALARLRSDLMLPLDGGDKLEVCEWH